MTEQREKWKWNKSYKQIPVNTNTIMAVTKYICLNVTVCRDWNWHSSPFETTKRLAVFLPLCQHLLLPRVSVCMSNFTSQLHWAWSRLSDKWQRTFKQSNIRLQWNNSRLELQTVMAVSLVIWQKAECSLAWQIRCLSLWAMVYISHRGRGYGAF